MDPTYRSSFIFLPSIKIYYMWIQFLYTISFVYIIVFFILFYYYILYFFIIDFISECDTLCLSVQFYVGLINDIKLYS